MASSLHLSQQHCTDCRQTEGVTPTARPLLIARSPYPCLGDDERDMDKKNAGTSNRPSESQSYEATQVLFRTKPTVNPRGPHYSGTHSQRTSSSSSSSSNLTSLSETGSAASRYDQHSGGTYEHQPVLSHRPENLRPGNLTGQYYHPYPVESYDPVAHHSPDGRQTGLVSSRFNPPQHTSVYQGRQPYENVPYVPVSTAYPTPYEYREYEQPSSYQQSSATYPPQVAQPRQLPHVSRQRPSLFKAYSAESHRERSLYESEGSQRGYSSLGETFSETPLHRYEQSATARQQYPLELQYRYQSDPAHFEGEPHTRVQYSQSSYSDSQSTGYSKDMHSTGASGEVDRLSEVTESMRLEDDDIEITKQPEDQSVNVNEKVVFTCEARVHCNEEPNMLWFKNREPLIGEIDSTCVIEDTTEKDAGVYHCLVTHPMNAAKQKESYPATLTVNTAQPPTDNLPKVVKQPLGQVAAIVGEALELTLQASGTEPLQYQWYKNSQPLRFAQSAVLRIPVPSLADRGDYCCRVANDNGSIMSQVFSIDVSRVRGAVPTDLSDSYLRRLSVAVAQQIRSIDELAYLLGIKLASSTPYRNLEDQVLQLLKTWRERTHGNKQQLVSTLNRLNIVLHDVGRSQVCQSHHKAAKLQFIKHPQSTKVIYGQSVSLQVTIANVTSSTRYQWYLNRKPLIGQTIPHLTISSVVDSDVGEYVCVASDRDIQITSESAIVELQDPYYHQGVQIPPPQPQFYDPPKRYLINRGGDSAQAVGREEQLSGIMSKPKEQVKETDSSSSANIVIQEHPLSVEIEPGDPLTLKCRATCSKGDLKYNWFFNGLLIKDEEQSEYLLNCFTDDDEGFYSCRVSNQFGYVMSDTAQVKAKIESD